MTAATLDAPGPAYPQPRRFLLQRFADLTGVSGVGDVAEGVEWTDGTVALRWRGRWPTTVVWDYGLEALLAVHGHGGASVVRWLDAEPEVQPSSP